MAQHGSQQQRCLASFSRTRLNCEPDLTGLRTCWAPLSMCHARSAVARGESVKKGANFFASRCLRAQQTTAMRRQASSEEKAAIPHSFDVKLTRHCAAAFRELSLASQQAFKSQSSLVCSFVHPLALQHYKRHTPHLLSSLQTFRR